jgi:hypothetical protein
MTSQLIDQVTVEFPVGEHTHVLCALWTDCIVLMPGTQAGDKLLTEPDNQWNILFAIHPEYRRVHNQRGWNMRQLRGLLQLVFIPARAQ